MTSSFLHFSLISFISLFISSISIPFIFSVSDIKRFGDKTAIGDRSFGKNKNVVSECGITAMKELQKNKIILVFLPFVM